MQLNAKLVWRLLVVFSFVVIIMLRSVNMLILNEYDALVVLCTSLEF